MQKIEWTTLAVIFAEEKVHYREAGGLTQWATVLAILAENLGYVSGTHPAAHKHL